MELVDVKTKRSFFIGDSNYSYLMKLFELDLSFDTHHVLLYDDTMEEFDSLDIAKKLESLLSDKTLYEYNSVNGNILPVLKPSNTALSDGFILNPIAEERIDFLKSLIKFLRVSGKLLIQ